jgi:hypothetical protein
VKVQFDTTRGNKDIIIKEINDNMKRFSSKLMEWKMLIKCHRKEVPEGVIAVTTQCVKGMMFNYASYLLNQFLLHYHDVQDIGTKFHFSWLIMLIALVGWQEHKFSTFLARDESLWK